MQPGSPHVRQESLCGEISVSLPKRGKGSQGELDWKAAGSPRQAMDHKHVIFPEDLGAAPCNWATRGRGWALSGVTCPTHSLGHVLAWGLLTWDFIITEEAMHLSCPQTKVIKFVNTNSMWLHAHLCPTPCIPVNCRLTVSSVHGIFQARILEWVASSYSRESSRPWDQTCIPWSCCTGTWILYHLSHLGIICEKRKPLSRVRLCNLTDHTVHGILQTRIREWVACPFS